MALDSIDFTTGPASIPDVGVVSYNGCVFSPLFETRVSGNVVQDEAKRTTKTVELTISVDGYVTLADGLADISPTMTTLYQLLTQCGGSLTYQGRGFDLSINPPAGGAGAQKFQRGARPDTDLAWGPVPKVLEFQPLGGGLSAKIRWQVTVHTTPEKAGELVGGKSPLLQFNYETTVTYGEDSYSHLSMRGTLEIPLTRPTQGTRTLPYTVDDFRVEVERRILSNLDLSRFRFVRRNFSHSRDKRTLTWDVELEEKGYMDLPPNCPLAHGNYTVRPAKTGPGLALWLCTLRATYVLRADVPRRQAWLLFLALMRLRMAEAKRGVIPTLAPGGGGLGVFNAVKNAPDDIIKKIQDAGVKTKIPFKTKVEDVRNSVLMDLNFNEGIYRDSKSITISATWRICTRWEFIILASGLWAKLEERTPDGKNLWATSMRAVNGAESWIENRLDPALDVVVDFGST